MVGEAEGTGEGGIGDLDMVDVVGDADYHQHSLSCISRLTRLTLGVSDLPNAPAPPPRTTGAAPLPILLLLLRELCPLDPLAFPPDPEEAGVLSGTV